MAVLQTNTISQNDIKLRWKEPYVSEATNIQAGVVKSGACRGGVVKETGTPSQSFLISIDTDPDTLVLHQNTTSGAANAVRFTSDQIVDMSGSFPVTSDESWYVYIDIDYTTGADTTGDIVVADTAPAGDEIRLGTIEMPSGATTILSSYVRIDGVHRTKSLQQERQVVTKRVFFPGTPGRTYFQINDLVHIDNSSSNAGQFNVDCFEAVSSNSALGDRIVDSNYRLFTPILYKDSGLTQPLIPIFDLDEDGCYDSPYVKIDFGLGGSGTYDDAFLCTYSTLSEYGDGDVEDVNLNKVPAHADNFGYATGTSGEASITGDESSGFVGKLLSSIDERIKKINTTSTTNWQLMWRSHNLSDISVDNDVTSIYFKDAGYMIVRGAYVNTASSNDEISFPLSYSGWGVSFDLLSGNGIRYYGADINSHSGSDVVDCTDPNEWEYHKRIGQTGSVVEKGQNRQFEANFMLFNVGDSSGDIYWPVFQATDQRFAVYFGGAGASINYRGFLFVSNAEWNDGSGIWQQISGSAESFAVVVNDGGIKMLRRDRDDVSTWNESGWTSEMAFMNTASVVGGTAPGSTDCFVRPTAGGDFYERIMVAFYMENNTGGSAAAAEREPINYSCIYNIPPSSHVFTAELSSNVDPAYPQVSSWSNSDEFGVVGLCQTISLADNGIGYFYGYVDVYS